MCVFLSKHTDKSTSSRSMITPSISIIGTAHVCETFLYNGNQVSCSSPGMVQSIFPGCAWRQCQSIQQDALCFLITALKVTADLNRKPFHKDCRVCFCAHVKSSNWWVLLCMDACSLSHQLDILVQRSVIK